MRWPSENLHQTGRAFTRPEQRYMGIRALIEWVRANRLDFDRWDTEQGNNFRSRYESFLTAPNLEPRKSRWQIEVAIKLADQPV